MNTQLKKNVDYVINEDGDLVFTAAFLLKRGFCCQSGCKNCPYDYSKKCDPNIPAEFQSSWSIEDSENNEEDD
jgi:hypothetical protein